MMNLSRNVYILVFAQACFFACSMAVFTFAGLAGQDLASDPAYATLPVSLYIVSAALATGPLSLLMQRTSRRFGFRLGASFGVFGGLLCVASLYSGSFLLLCVATVSMGPFQASAQYYRFAAGESVAKAQAPRAISLILLGGVAAAFVVPVATGWLNSYFEGYSYLGSFVFVVGAATLVFLPIAFLKPIEAKHGSAETSEAGEIRPLGQIVRTPKFIIAVINAGLGYAMMSFVMTATPLAMVEAGFPASQGAYVIQWHVVAMFLPGLVTGSLITRFGVLPILLAGQALFAGAFVVALSGAEVWQFTLSLVMLGIGWNFCFVGGTSLLTRVHTDNEKGKVQGVNEIIVFGFSGVASFGAGVILQKFGWATVNETAFAMLGIAVVATVIWGLTDARKQPVPES